MKQANSSFKFRSLLQRLISMTLVFCLIFGLSAETIAFASETLSAEMLETVEHRPDIPTYPNTVTNTAEETLPPRSLDELKSLPGVYMDETGRVTHINRSLSDLTPAEINLLFGIDTSPDKQTVNAGLRSSGMTASEFEAAALLHGGENVFSRELLALNRGIENDSLSADEYANIKLLICNGYTYRQARAAIVTSAVLGVTVEALCQAKLEELASVEGGVELTSANANYSAAAVKLGVPYSIVEDFAILHNQANIENIVDAASTAMKASYPSTLENSMQSGLTPVGSFVEPTATSNETPAVSYAPKKVLTDPFSYKSSGNMNISLATGDFIYSETDLYIPGIAGLDLSITRQYVSAFAFSEEPYGRSTGLYDDEETLQLVYDLYISTDLSGNGQFYLVSNPASYTIADSWADSLLGTPIENFKTSEYFSAIAAKDYYSLSDLANELWLAYDSDGNDCAAKFVPALKPIGNFEDAFEILKNDYDYLVDEFGLGHGWRLGFSAIETYFNTLTGTLDERLILSDGRAIGIDENGDLIYSLNDMWLSDSGEGYAGAEYTLHYADGKKEYFDANGRNIAIVDRYGNEIKIEYVATGIYVHEMKITDTLGNVVVFKDLPLDLGDSTSLTLNVPGGSRSYTRARTLTLNGVVIRTYYSYDQSFLSTASETNYLTKLVAVKDSENQYTLIDSNSTYSNCNCFVSTASTNDFKMPYSALSSVQSPNGLRLEIKYVSSNKKDVLGYSGYQESSAFSNVGYYYQTENGKIYQDRVAYKFGDYSGYSTVINDYSTFTTTEEKQRNKLINGVSSSWGCTNTEYIFNYKNQLLEVNDHIYDTNLLEEDVTSLSDIRRTKQIHSITRYTYNGTFPLPSTVSAEIYEPGDTGIYMDQNHSYTYDAKGNVTSETLPNNLTVTYTYSADYNLPLTTTYQQNASTTIVEQNTLTADSKSIAATTVTSNGTVVSKTAYTYDAKGRTTAVDTYTSATEYTTQQLTYGNQAQVTQITTAGIKTADGTDAAATPGNTAGTIVEKTTYNARGWPVSYTDANGKATSVTYDTLGRITRVTYPDGGTDQYVYDTANNTVTYTDANENVFTYKYDPFGNLIEIYDNATSQALVSYRYDSLGQKILETIHSTDSTKDQITYYEHDSAGRVTTIGTKNSTGTKTPLETYTYDAALGKTTHTVLGSTNAPDFVEIVYVDNMGNTIHTGRTLDGTEYLDTYAYDYLGNCVVYKSAYTASVGGSYTEKYTYDHAGNLLTTTDALNNTVTNTYDWRGNATRFTDALGNITQYTYDKLGRLTKTVSPIDSGKDHTVKYYYDPAGNLSKQLTSTGTEAGQFSTVEYVYDSMNRLTEVTTPLNSTTSYSTTYTYDQMGNVLSARYGNTKVLNSDSTETVTPSPNATTYTYDRFGNVLTETNALSKTELYTYDLSGNILSKQDRNGVTTQYTYDNRGRLVTEAIGSGTAGITRNYTYALNGLLLSESQGSDTVSYTYDALQRLTGETNGSMQKAYTYNIGDLCTSFKAGTSLTSPLVRGTYTYNSLGQLTRASSGQGPTATYTYNANGNPSQVAYGSIGQQDYTYTAGNLIDSIVTVSGVTQYTNEYDYDYSGRQISYTEGTDVVSYQYDALGQLVSESRLGTASYEKTYTYDSRGNRTQMVSNGATTNYTYDAANRLLTATPQTSGTATTYTYDNAGNLLSETCGTATVGYSYTADNQLAAVDLGLLRTEYSYYPGGLRKTKSTRNTNTNSVVGSIQYVWNGSDLVLEDDGTTATKYFYGLDLYGSVAATGTTSPMPNYYFHDAHGNVSRITSGITVTHTYLYDAFGNQLTTVADDTNPFRYCGEYYDSETENYCLRARYYDPGVGRFTQQDTHWNTANMIYGDNPQKINERKDALGMKTYSYAPQISAIVQSGNLYVYCGSDPIGRTDPTGNEWYHWVLGGLIVAAAAAVVVVTAGGALPALYAIGAAAGGIALGGVGTTVAAGAFIGGATALGFSAFIAASDSHSFADFGSRGNWGTVASTAGSSAMGGLFGYASFSESERNNIFANKTYTNDTGEVINYTSNIKGIDAAQADFYKLNPKIVYAKDGTPIGYLSNGCRVNIHPGRSVNSAPTLEIYNPFTGKSIKIRY